MIYIGADHAGFDLKKILKNYLEKLGYEVEDLGNKKLELRDDYPDFGKAVAKKVAKEKRARGIVICGSGNGICMAANKIAGIRAALAYNEYAAKMAKRHEDANILCLASRVLKPAQAKKIVKTWLEEEISTKPRHLRRIKKIHKLEK